MMKKLSSLMCQAVALTFAVGSAFPAAAAPAFAPHVPSISSHVIDVQNRRDDRRWDRRDDRRWDRQRDRRSDRFERRGNNAYWRGHRGYREHRPGYRQHEGWWFPSAAFIAGAIIGGATNNPPAVRTVPAAHVRWCQDRWRSYRVSDNSYQPYNGPRRQCTSPYG